MGRSNKEGRSGMSETDAREIALEDRRRAQAKRLNKIASKDRAKNLRETVRNFPPKRELSASGSPPPDPPSSGNKPTNQEIDRNTKAPDRTPAERAIDRSRQTTREAIQKRDAMRPHIKARAMDAAMEKGVRPLRRSDMDVSKLRKTEIEKPSGVSGAEKEALNSRHTISDDRAEVEARRSGMDQSDRWKKGMQRAGAKNSVERRKKIVEEARRPWQKAERAVRKGATGVVKEFKKAVPFAESKLKGAADLAKFGAKAYGKEVVKGGLKGMTKRGLAGAAAGAAYEVAKKTQTGENVINTLNDPLDLKRGFGMIKDAAVKAGKKVEEFSSGGQTVRHPGDKAPESKSPKEGPYRKGSSEGGYTKDDEGKLSFKREMKYKPRNIRGRRGGGQ